MPIVFLRERTDLKTLEPVREVVDGQQRLRTLIAFIEPNLLKDYNEAKDSFTIKKGHNEELAGKSFRQLDADQKKQILNYDFSVHILPSDTDDRDVLQIFARMNSSGVKLNDQELRNAKYYGAFKKLSYTLAYEQLSRWRDWKIFSELEIARMSEVEETSEFIKLMLNGIQSKSQPALNRLYEQYEDIFPHEAEVTRRFHFVMDRIEESLGSQISISAFTRVGLFETLFVFYYDLLFGLGSKLKRLKANKLPLNLVNAVSRTSNLVLHGDLPEDLTKVLRGGTGNKESRIRRLKFLRDNFKRAKS